MKLHFLRQMICVSCFLLVGSLTFPSFFSHAQGAVVKKIEIHGNKRIELQTIMSYLPVHEGDDLGDVQRDDALKELFKTGYFKSIEIIQKGQILHVDVVENPIIDKIQYEGNDKLRDDDIKKFITLKSREICSSTKVQAAQQTILEIYRRMGRFNAKVTPKIISLSQNRVDLVFEIEEGDVTNIRKIRFIGNKNISDTKLLEAIKTKEYRWYRFWASDDVYDPDRFSSDQEDIEKFYRDRGYADARVIASTAELSVDQKDFYLTFTIDEGKKYTVKNVKITTKIPEIKVDHELKAAVDISEGSVLSEKEIEHSIRVLTLVLESRGYAFISIAPIIHKPEQPLINDDKAVAELEFVIGEGMRATIEKIHIKDNNRTRDHVIRRELSILEGDAYNGNKIKESEENLKALNFFEEAAISTEEGSSPDQAVLIVSAKDKPTGELSGGLTFSTIDGPGLTAGIRERNLAGTGRELSLQGSMAKNYRMVGLGLEDPRLFDRPLTGIVNIHGSEDRRARAFGESEVGTMVGLGYRLARYWNQQVFYEFVLGKVYGIQPTSSPVLRGQAKSFTKSKISHVVSYNRLNSYVDPTGGYLFRFGNGYAGLGGTVSYWSNFTDVTAYYALSDDDVILKFYGHISTVEKAGGKIIRVADSLTLGGETMRGFEYGGIGPRDEKTGDALNGTRLWRTSLELKIPSGFPKEWGVTFAAFVDAGSVWKPGARDENTIDHKVARVSAGGGFYWRSPFGNIGVFYGRPIKKAKNDRTMPVLISFNSSF